MRSVRWRSLLFAPGDRPDRIPKAFAAVPDGVIVDLEDGVHPSRLQWARERTVEALSAAGDGGVARLVRVHPAGHEALVADLAAVVGPHLDAVVLPKVDGPADVLELDLTLRDVEADAGLAVGSVGVVPLIESCRGLRRVFETARSSSRVLAMAFSSGEEGDFMADLGGRWTPDGAALAYPRSRFVCDVRAAGGIPALDGVCMHLDDPAVLQSECALARTLGFDGKIAIHPAQLAAVHRTFTPSEAEVEDARRLLEALGAAAAEGVAAARYDGRMIDPANARLARRVLEQASGAPGTDAAGG
ncbi:MAG: HpcH/HpaI aldolase/citrate lyase family protein [Acidimicrobiales bacterium]